jgi:hypothetical protein
VSKACAQAEAASLQLLQPKDEDEAEGADE